MRILIKASGQTLAGGNGFGIDPDAVTSLAKGIIAASVQRAIELEMDLLLAARNGADGAYDADPATNSDAVRSDTISFDDVIEKNIRVGTLVTA
jgi:uridylate kinase